MRVVIAGGSGFIGRPLCRALFNENGHEVLVLTRKDPRATVPYARVIPWDGQNPGAWQEALEGAETLINLCGADIASGRWTEQRKRLLRDSRVLPTRALVAALAAAKNGPRVFISASAVGYYGDRDELVDEQDSAGADFLARLCVEWEAEALRAPAGVRTVLLRTGVVLDEGGGALAKMLLPFRLGLGGPIGDGTQWMSWISREDVVGLISRMIAQEISGPVNLTAPEPVTNEEFSKALGRALHRPAKLRLPPAVVKLAFGELGTVLLGGQRAVPHRAQQLGYAFKHPSLDSALANALR